MIIDFHRNFDKSYKKIPPKQRSKLKAQLELFIRNRYDPELNNHGLKGKYKGYRSINVSGDIRALFIEHNPQHVEFVYIGSHAQLYK